MNCSDTGCHPAVRLEHLALKDAKRLNKVVSTIKSIFKGDANILLMFSGGKLGKIKFYETSYPLGEEE